MPDLERTKAALLKSAFTVYQDAYYPTETAAYAHVLLPAAQWGEKTGTMTNSERVVTLCSSFRDPVGEARPDWEIFAEVGRRLGFTEQFNFKHSRDVHREFVELTRDRPCDMTGLSYEQLRQDGPTQWPYPAQKTPEPSPHEPVMGLFSNLFKGKEEKPARAKRLYTNWHFNTPDGRAKFVPFHAKGLAEPPDGQYPFVLTVGRLYGHWHTMTRTGRIEKIAKMHPKPFLEIHPKDAQKLGIEEGQLVEVQSRRGKARFPAMITKGIAPGCVFAPMHWGALWADDAEPNTLTHPSSCPISLEPELKACAVQLVPVAALREMENRSPQQKASSPKLASVSL
jgi:ferredoxin-nitrate reductase